VRTPAAKLIETISPFGRSLFDLAADPGEQHDVLAARPEQAATLAEELANARAPLWRTGYQLRIASDGVPYRVRLWGSGTFQTLDRAGPTEPQQSVEEDSRHLVVGSLGVKGTLALRFDRQRAEEGADIVHLAGTPGRAVQIGAGIPLHGRNVDLTDPSLETAAEPPCETPRQGVRVCLWRMPHARSTPLPDAATRERLRALGYAE
jgi:hypothetical protein